MDPSVKSQLRALKAKIKAEQAGIENAEQALKTIHRNYQSGQEMLGTNPELAGLMANADAAYADSVREHEAYIVHAGDRIKAVKREMKDVRKGKSGPDAVAVTASSPLPAVARPESSLFQRAAAERTHAPADPQTCCPGCGQPSGPDLCKLCGAFSDAGVGAASPPGRSGAQMIEHAGRIAGHAASSAGGAVPPGIPALPGVRRRAESIGDVYGTLFDEIAKGVEGGAVDRRRIDDALNKHTHDQMDLGGLPWLPHAFMDALWGDFGGGGGEGGGGGGGGVGAPPDFLNTAGDWLPDWFKRSIYGDRDHRFSPPQHAASLDRDGEWHCSVCGARREGDQTDVDFSFARCDGVEQTCRTCQVHEQFHFFKGERG